MILRSRTAAPLRPALFGVWLATLFGIEASALSIAAPHDQVVGAVAALELTCGPAFLFYVLWVRRGAVPIAWMAPVVLAAFGAARLVLPTGSQFALDTIGVALVPLEAAAIAMGLRRMAGFGRRIQRADSDDLLVQVQTLLIDQPPALAAVLGTELAVPWYALVGPFKRPLARSGVVPFPYRRAWQPLFFALFGLLMIETVGMHLLVSMLNPAVATVLTALSLYGALWLVADYQAARLRPILVTREGILIRSGLRWTVHVPTQSIAGVEAIRSSTVTSPDRLDASLDGAPMILLRLKAPAEAIGPLGTKRTVIEIAIGPDEPERLIAAVNDLIN